MIIKNQLSYPFLCKSPMHGSTHTKVFFFIITFKILANFFLEWTKIGKINKIKNYFLLKTVKLSDKTCSFLTSLEENIPLLDSTKKRKSMKALFAFKCKVNLSKPTFLKVYWKNKTKPKKIKMSSRYINFTLNVIDDIIAGLYCQLAIPKSASEDFPEKFMEKLVCVNITMV